MLGIWKAAMKCAFDSESPNGAPFQEWFLCAASVTATDLLPARVLGREGLHGRGMWLGQSSFLGPVGAGLQRLLKTDPGLRMPELAAVHPAGEYVQFSMGQGAQLCCSTWGQAIPLRKGLCSWYYVWRTTPQKP